MESNRLYPYLMSKFKFVPDTFDGSDTVNAQLLADLTNVYVDRTVAYDHIITPDLVKDLVSEKDAPGF